MNTKVLITILGENIAPRFDKTSEVFLFQMGKDGQVDDQRTMVLHQSSPEDLCQLIVSQDAQIVVCGGIEEEYYEYLKWKKILVFDSVMGPYTEAISSLGVDINDDLALVVSYTLRNNSDVLPGTEKTDTFTAITIEYSY